MNRLGAALLSDGDLIVESSDINITSGTPGALFGIVATVDGQGNQIIHFNDDNTNSVMRMTQ